MDLADSPIVGSILVRDVPSTHTSYPAPYAVPCRIVSGPVHYDVTLAASSAVGLYFSPPLVTDQSPCMRRPACRDLRATLNPSYLTATAGC